MSEINISSSVLIQTFISALIASAVSVMFTDFIKGLGLLKLLRNEITKLKYYKYTDESKTTVKEVTSGYDFFTLTFNIGIYNQSKKSKMIRNIHYYYCPWKKEYPDTKYLVDAIDLSPMEVYNLKFIIPYKKEYLNYLYNRKHYIVLQNSYNKEKRIRIPLHCIQKTGKSNTSNNQAILNVSDLNVFTHDTGDELRINNG